jgi:ribonuclease J
MGIASDLGYLKVPEGILIDAKKAADLPDDKLVYMSTGSQGEPMAVLARMANGEHQIEVGKGDTVILASSLIPGNENAVYRVINGLTKLGANVVHKGNAKVHVSGHASAGELLYCYNILKPKNVLPVHGEYRHLVANQQLAIQTGIPEENTIIAEDGTVIDLRDGEATVVGQLDIGLRLRRRVHRRRDHGCRPQGSPHPRRRGVHLHLRGHRRPDRSGYRRAGGPVPRFRRRRAGVRGGQADDHQGAHEAAENGTRDTHAFSQVIRRTVGRWVNTQHRRRPMIVPVVIEA